MGRKTYRSLLVMLAIILAFSMTWSGTAQKMELEQPTTPLLTSENSSIKSLENIREERVNKHPALLSPDSVLQAETSDQDLLGLPKIVYTYAESFGTVDHGYLDDTDHLYSPSGVFASGSDIWIVDSWGNRALRYDNLGNFIFQVGKTSQRDASGTSLDYLTDIAIGSDGSIWIVDSSARHVAHFDGTGLFLGDLGSAWESGSSNDHFSGPVGIAMDSAGNIYVSDGQTWDDGGNQRIQIFDSTGAYLNTIGVTGVAGSDNGHFYSPRRIAIYGDILYVADRANHRVQIFNVANPLSPAYLHTIGISGVPGSDNDHLDYPQGVSIDSNFIYVADSNNARVQVFWRGSYAYAWTIGGSWGSGNDQFGYIEDVSVGSSGELYISDAGNDRVQKYGSDWTYERTYGTTDVPYLTDEFHFNSPSGVAVSEDGSIYLVESRGHRLIKLDSAGNQLWTVGEPGISAGDNEHLSYPQDVGVDGLDRAYVVDSVNHRIQVFQENGTYLATIGGTWGSGLDQLKSPQGLAIDSLNRLYIADTDNHRVQIYDSNRNYLATLGVTGIAGADNSHFNTPREVAVDPAGNIYVLDHANHRVQVFSSSLVYQRTIGETGICIQDYSHLCNPDGLAVDKQGNVYVADSWGSRVQVFDTFGTYLTTVTSGWGVGTTINRSKNSDGIAFDRAGNLYVTDNRYHQVVKFSPGVPGWRQVNVNGFGVRSRYLPLDMIVRGDTLYLSVYDWVGRASLWKTADFSSWEQVISSNFIPDYSGIIYSLADYGDYLYAGTSTWDETTYEYLGGEIWRSLDASTWEKVVDQGFGYPEINDDIDLLYEFDNILYATTWSYSAGAQIWRSADGQNWENEMSGGYNDPNTGGIPDLVEHNGDLYAGTWGYYESRARVFRQDSPGVWTAVTPASFSSSYNNGITAMASFDGYLYVGTRNNFSGGEIWRCQACNDSDGWNQVITPGYGNIDNSIISAFSIFNNQLFAITYNQVTGAEIWRSADGLTWEQIGFGGLGDSQNIRLYASDSAIEFRDTLVLGFLNQMNGLEIWQFLHNKLFLPIITR